MKQEAQPLTVTAENFMRDVIEASAVTPVLVDFWAPWCGPCKQLMPMLDRLATEYAGRFTLAKVNTDEEQELAQQVGVRSLPTVVLFKDGAPATHFIGVQPEAQIRALLDEHLPASPVADDPAQRARLLQASADYAGARQALEEALAKDKNNVELSTSLAELHVLEGELDIARAELADLQNREPQHRAVKRLTALLGFADLAAAHGDVRTLKERADQDAEARSLIAVHSLLAGEHDAALNTWLDLMRTERSLKEEARKRLVMAFDLLGEEEATVAEARRAMAKMLF
jgi:putative thioredoxin